MPLVDEDLGLGDERVEEQEGPPAPMRLGYETDDRMECPDCGSDMVLRRGKYGLFYGCIAFRDRGCRGGVSCNEYGDPRGIPGNQATRAARKEAMDTLERVKDKLPAEVQSQIRDAWGPVGALNEQNARALANRLKYEAGERDRWSRLGED